MSFSDALPILLRVRAKAKTLRGILGCRNGEHLHPVPAQELPMLQWSCCPLDLVDSDPRIRALRALEAMGQVSPLSGWPHRYAAWAVQGLMTLRQREG